MLLEQDTYNVLHDILFDLIGVGLPNKILEMHYDCLPGDIKCDIEKWGANDTPTRENIYEFTETHLDEFVKIYT